MFDPYVIRKDFPILNQYVYGKKLIYFDNIATSQKPIQVINSISDFYKRFNANIHRGMHYLSQEASRLYEEAHETVAKFIRADADEIIFVRNTTEGLNLVAYAWGLKNLGEDDEIIITIMEHHSNMLPWFKLAKLRKANVKVIYVDKHGRLNYKELENMITKRTKIIAITHISNVTGVINDIKYIAKLAHDVEAKIVVDGAQSVPHLPVNVQNLDIDFMAFSGHKMLGPTGIGVLYINKRIHDEMDTFIVGGDTIKEVHYNNTDKLKVIWHDYPWRFEAGTPNIAGAVGLAEAVKYLINIGMNNIHKHELKLVEYTLKRIRDDLHNVKIMGPPDLNMRSGVISFIMDRLDPHALAILLDEYGIAVRSGFHCAQPLHEYLGFKSGSVRIGFYLYNTIEEVDVFIEAMKKIENEITP